MTDETFDSRHTEDESQIEEFDWDYDFDKPEGLPVATIVPPIEISREETELRAYVDSGAEQEFRIGDYVRIPSVVHDGEEIFAKVTGIQQRPFSERTNFEYNRDGNSVTERSYDRTNLNQSIKIDPVAVLEPGDDGEVKTRPVDIAPYSESPVHQCRNELLLRKGIGIPEEGPFVADVAVSGKRKPSDSNPLAYRLHNPSERDEDPAIFRHMLIAGSTGKGKTHFTKNLLRQLIDKGEYEIVKSDENNSDAAPEQLGMFIIDPENEYHGLGSPNDSLDDDVEDEYRNRGIVVGGVNESRFEEELRVAVPKVTGAGSPENIGQNTISFSIPFSLLRDFPHLLVKDSGASTQTVSAIGRIINHYFNKVQGRPDNFNEFVDWLNEQNDKISADNEYTVADSLSLHEETWKAAKRRIDTQVNKNVFGNTEPSLEDRSGDLFKPGQITVMPTRHLSTSENLVVASVLSYIIDNKLKNDNVDKNIKDTPLFLTVDEAHNYLANPTTARQQNLVQKFRLGAKQGRKYNLGLGLVTQDPLDIDEEILQQLNSKILMGLEPTVVEKLEVPGNFGDDLLTFGKGQAVVKAPDVRAVEVVGLENCVTQH